MRMSLPLERLGELVRRHGCVVRVLVGARRGSAPREPGAQMLVWGTGQWGTIGGGALELDALRKARAALGTGAGAQAGAGTGSRSATPGGWIERVALGPGLGQCCGGAVTLVFERFDAQALDAIRATVFARRIEGAKPMPLAFRRMLREHRATGRPVTPGLSDGWLIEPTSTPARSLWIYGAGHVGRAVVAVLAPLPQFAITWVDTSPSRFPEDVAPGIDVLCAENPADLVPHAPRDGDHLIFTYSHALDLELCHRLLRHEFAHAGLIGSATKWARFRSQLASLGHAPDRIARITCPIGQPALGKHPQAIAIGVARELLQRQASPRPQAQEPNRNPGRKNARSLTRR